MSIKLLTRNYLAISLLFLTAITPTVSAQSAADKLLLTTATIITTAHDEEKRIQTEPFIRTELFFGRNKPDGTEVTEEEFAHFLSETVTPEFPDGLTVLSGIGQFRNADGGIIQEQSKILILLYPLNTRRSSSCKIERIRETYKKLFEQQSVLRADDTLPLKVSF